MGTPRSEDALREQIAWLTRLHELDTAVAEAESPEAIAEIAVRHLLELTPSRQASVITFDFEAGLATVLAAYSAGEGPRRGGSRWPLDSIDLPEELRAGRISVSGSDLSVPLLTKDELIGVIRIGSASSDAFTGAHVDTSLSVAKILGPAIHRASRHDRLLRHAVTLERRVTELRRKGATRAVDMSEVVQAQEQERQRIAGDIHDDSAQVMTTALYRLSRLRQELIDPRHVEKAEEIEQTMALAITRLRRLMFDLVPPAIDRQPLRASVHAYLRRVKDDTGLDFRLDDRLANEPPMEARTIAYRIVQEAVTNVVKHAGATRVVATMEERDGGLLLTVADNGQGFALRDVLDPIPGHLGLTAMRQRAEMAGGWCRIQSRPDAGTTVLCWIPEATVALAEASGEAVIRSRRS
jgi:signal transduction histidine kinase